MHEEYCVNLPVGRRPQ